MGRCDYPRSRPSNRWLMPLVSQQISGRAAEAIMNRLRDRIPIEPEPLARANVRDPSSRRALSCQDHILGRAGTVYGRGRIGWHRIAAGRRCGRTLNLGQGNRSLDSGDVSHLSLNRPDVWPVGDGGIQRAALNLYRIRSPRSLQKLGERFRPVRTHAAWYLWRSLDEA